jgi:thioredoxin 1
MLTSSIAFVPLHVRNHVNVFEPRDQPAAPQQHHLLLQARERARSTAALLMATKTGGKLISTCDEYTEFVTSTAAPRPVLVFFTAVSQLNTIQCIQSTLYFIPRSLIHFFLQPWCGPCRLSIPVVKDVMKVFAGKIDVVEVCTDDLPEVASESGVVSIPTIQMYYKSELMDTIVGCVAKTVLSSAVEKVLEDVSIRFGVGDADSDPNGKAP